LVCTRSDDITIRCRYRLFLEKKGYQEISRWYFLAPFLFMRIILCYCSKGPGSTGL